MYIFKIICNFVGNIDSENARCFNETVIRESSMAEALVHDKEKQQSSDGEDEGQGRAAVDLAQREDGCAKSAGP